MTHAELARITAGMTTERWATVPIELVDIRTLYPIQKSVDIIPLMRIAAGDMAVGTDPFPHIVAADGQLFIEDGHHRILVWAIRGCALMPCRVYRRRTG